MAHIKWDQMKALPDPTAWEIQIAYVDGYILALEDALHDLNEIGKGWKGQKFGPFMEAIKASRTAIARSLTQARQTKEVLVEKRPEILRVARATDSSIEVHEGMEGSSEDAA